jgi:hypothetical protein
MLATDWDFFMPDTAIEKSELEAACDKSAEILNKWTSIECPQVTAKDSSRLAEFAISVACEDTDSDLVGWELSRALIQAGETLMRRLAYLDGVKQGRFESKR